MGSLVEPIHVEPRRDVLEIRRYGSTWNVALARRFGMATVALADFNDSIEAERFARHFAEVRGDTDVRRSFA